MLPSTLQVSRYLPVLGEGESPSQGGGERPAVDSGSTMGRVIFKRETYSTRFEDVFVIGRD